MEEAVELYPDEPTYRTRVWITSQGLKEFNKEVHPVLASFFENQARKGFQEYRGPWIRDEGDGVSAYGTDKWTTRIAGYFTDSTRRAFVVGGVWSGKSGGGNARPPRGDTVAARVAALKRAGVKFIEARPQE